MTITDRIATILSSVEFQLAQSLPMINNEGKEVIFFYKVKEINKEQYLIPEIRYVVFRDIKTNEIVKANASEVLPDSILDKVTFAPNFHTKDVEDELHLEDEYLDYYEKAYEGYTSIGIIEKEIIDGLSVAFHKLLDGTNLQCVYSFLASDFTEMLG